MFSHTSRYQETREETEREEMMEFLDNSTEYKRLRQIFRRCGQLEGCESMTSWINSIENAKSLWDILHITRDIDPKHTENIVVYNLGRNKLNVLLFFGGYVSERANFTYNLLHLRESIEDYKHLDRKTGGYW